jgi:RHS repeat-associated protein
MFLVAGFLSAQDVAPSPSEERVPETVGRSAKEARASVTAAGLVCKFQIGSPASAPEKEFTVYSQSPLSGARAIKGQTVRLLLYGRFEGRSTAEVSAAPELVQVWATPFLDKSEEQADLRSGRVVVSVLDMNVPAGGTKIELRRTWIGPGRNGLLGGGWRLNWDRRLTRSPSRVVIEDGPGQIQLTPDKNGESYQSPAGDLLRFEERRAVWVRPGGIQETFDEQGRLVTRDELNGNRLTLSYGPAGDLSRIEGPGGASVQFTADEKGRITRAESSTGHVVQYVFSGGKAPAQDPAVDLVPLSYSYDGYGLLTRVEHPRQGATEFAYDARGRIQSRQWSDGAKELFVYDDATRTLNYTDATGHVTRTTWSVDGRRAEVTSPSGLKALVEYDQAGRTVALTGPTNQTVRFSYDALGRTKSVEDPAKGITRLEYLRQTSLPTLVSGPREKRTTLEYDAASNLTRLSDETDPSQNATFSYFSNGQVQTAVYGSGQQHSFTYDDLGRRKSITDAEGHVWRYEYDVHGNVVREINPAGGATQKTYDAHNRLTSVTDPTGATTRFAYEQRGRFFSIVKTNARGIVTRSIYDQRGRLSALRDGAGQSTHYSYDASGRIVSVSNPAGQTYQYEYDADGRRVSEKNPLGAVTQRTYDALDHVTKVIAADGAISTYEYSPAGLLAKVTDGAHLAAAYEHDSLGRLSAATDALQRTAQYECTPSGRLSKLIPMSGPIVTRDYDAQGRLARIRRGEQTLVEYAYDLLGHRTKEVRAGGREIAFRYDALGQMVAWHDNQGGSGTIERDAVGRPVALIDALGASTKLEYDPVGNLLSTTDALGKVRKRAYDHRNRLIEVAEPTGDVARYEYDPAGHLASVRHPGGGTSTYQYDALGRPVSSTVPSGGQAHAKYDATGRLLETTDAKGQLTRFSYNSAGQLAEKVLADKKTVRCEYNAQGRLTKVDDGAFPVIYGYDESGHVTRIEYPAIKRSLAWDYNDAGLKTRFIDSEGRAVQYQYDEFDRLTAMKPADGGPLTFAYDAKNRVIAVAWPNGVKGAWQFDAEDRPLTLTYTDAGGKKLAGWDYKYDAAGNLTETLEEGHTTRYQHDARGQLLAESFGNEKGTTYTYFPGGNRAKREAGGSATEYRYNESDQLLAAGKETFRYDANGNVVERHGPAGMTEYTYDVENRLVGVKRPDGETVEYRYAPTGERIARIDAKGTTYYVTDGVNLLAELGGDLKPRATYLNGPRIDQPLLMTRDGQTWCFHADRLGSIRRLTDSRGTKAADYDYDAFGQPRDYENSLVSPFTYAAREFDAATGLYYNRRRYYDPRLGRFLAVDPAQPELAEPRTLNPYLYALNSPLLYIDPMGTDENPVDTSPQPLDPYDPYAPIPLPRGLTRSTPLKHFTRPQVADAAVAGQELGWGPSGESLHMTTLAPGSGARYPEGIGTPSNSWASFTVTAGDVVDAGMVIVPNTNPYYEPGTNWIIMRQPGQDVVKLPGAYRTGPYFPANQDGGSRNNGRGGFLNLPDVDLSAAGNVAGPVGLMFLGLNLMSDVLEGQSPVQIITTEVPNGLIGIGVGSAVTLGATALGYGIGAAIGLLGGPPLAVGLATLGGGFAIGAMLGIGAMGTGKRLGQDLGALAGDSPVGAGPANWADLPPPPFDLGLSLLDPQSWGYPSNSGNAINPWSVFAPGSDDDILRRALAAEAQLGQNNGLGTNQRPYWASPRGYGGRGANNQAARQRQSPMQRQSQMQGRGQGQRQQTQSGGGKVQPVTGPPPLQLVPAFTPVQAPKPLQVQGPPPLPGAISSQPASTSSRATSSGRRR